MMLMSRQLLLVMSVAALTLLCGTAQAQAPFTIVTTAAPATVQQNGIVTVTGAVQNPNTSGAFDAKEVAASGVVTGQDVLVDFSPFLSGYASLAAGQTYQGPLFTIDTSQTSAHQSRTAALPLGLYSVSYTLSFVSKGPPVNTYMASSATGLTVVPAPEPSSLMALSLAAAGLTVLPLCARLRRTHGPQQSA